MAEPTAPPSDPRLSAAAFTRFGQLLDNIGGEPTIQLLMEAKTGRPSDIIAILEQDGIIVPSERAAYLEVNGDLTEVGKTLIQRVLFRSVLDDVLTGGAFESAIVSSWKEKIERAEAVRKSLANKVEHTLADLTRLKARGGEWDITPLSGKGCAL